MNIIETSKKILAAIRDSDLVGASQMVLELESHALKLVEENASLQARLEELESHPDLVSSMHFDGTFKTVSGYESKWYECHNCQSRIEL
jgi:hypothetical protein